MRVETVESVEFVRRIKNKIYDEAEYQRIAAWAKTNCKVGEDRNKNTRCRSSLTCLERRERQPGSPPRYPSPCTRLKV